MTDNLERAHAILAAAIRAHNDTEDGNEVTLWPDETEVVVAAMLAFAQQAPEGWREALKPFADLADEIERVASDRAGGSSTPSPAVSAKGAHPSRTESQFRDKMNFLLGARGKPSAFARDYGVVDEQVLAFLRGARPPEPKLLEAFGYRREYVYSPCPCYACTSRRTALDPGTMMLGQSVDMMRMFLCETCGNKHCPHAADHRNACTGSNETGQPGSLYAASVDRNPEGEDRNGLRAEHESAVGDSRDAQPPAKEQS